GFLVFAQCDRAAAPLPARTGGAGVAATRHLQAWRRLGQRLGLADAPEAPLDPGGPGYSDQLFLQSFPPPTAAPRGAARTLFERSWRQLETIFTESSRSGQAVYTNGG